MSDLAGEQRDPARLVDPAGDDTDRARRDAMVRLARYAAPAMLALLVNDKAMAAS
ncbi:MAG: hypothetical protein ABIL01_18790 [Pseudomonadota bacterium]